MTLDHGPEGDEAATQPASPTSVLGVWMLILLAVAAAIAAGLLWT